MKSLKRSWWKITLIVFISTVIHIIFMALAASADTSSVSFKPSIFVREGLKIPSICIYAFIVYFELAIVFTFIEDKLPGKKWYKGLLFSFPFGILYFTGMFEGMLLWSDTILNSILMGLADFTSILFMGILLGIFTGTNQSCNEKKSKPLSIFIVTIFIILGRYFSYSVLHIQSAYASKPLGTFIWTLCVGLSVGIMYFNLKQGIKGNSLVSRGIFLGAIIFGLNWLMYHLYIAILAEVSFTDIFTRVGIDALFAAVGVFIYEKLFETK